MTRIVPIRLGTAECSMAIASCASKKAACFNEQAALKGFIRLLRQCLRHRNCHGDGRADHRVVAHADEAHHLDVRRD